MPECGAAPGRSPNRDVGSVAATGPVMCWLITSCDARLGRAAFRSLLTGCHPYDRMEMLDVTVIVVTVMSSGPHPLKRDNQRCAPCRAVLYSSMLTSADLPASCTDWLRACGRDPSPQSPPRRPFGSHGSAAWRAGRGTRGGRPRHGHVPVRHGSWPCPCSRCLSPRGRGFAAPSSGSSRPGAGSEALLLGERPLVGPGHPGGQATQGARRGLVGTVKCANGAGRRPAPRMALRL